MLPESFGIVALEAAAAGKPTVVSDIGGLSDVVVDGETGLLVAPGDREELRRRCARLLRGCRAAASGWERRPQARAGSFGPDAVVPRFEEAYELARQARLKPGGRRRR